MAFTGSLAPAAAQEPPRIATLTGVVSVVDGDGLLFGDVEVRLQGVAAPEARDRPNGPSATAALKTLSAGRNVTCYLDGTTASSNRPVGVCFVGDLDLGEAMIRQGFARDCPAFSGGRYAPAEAEARRQGHNLSRSYKLPGYC